MSRKSRSAKSGCPISYSLDLFGDRWTLLVLRDLILWGKSRFAELLSSDERIASNILSDRLRRLEAEGIIESRPAEDDARQKLYAATTKGETLVPVLLEIAAWGASHDDATGAPPGFAEAYYDDRKGFHRDFRGRIEKLSEPKR